ncbi:hypothetical protein [Nonomuraea sp. NPDC049480]
MIAGYGPAARPGYRRAGDASFPRTTVRAQQIRRLGEHPDQPAGR